MVSVYIAQSNVVCKDISGGKEAIPVRAVLGSGASTYCFLGEDSPALSCNLLAWPPTDAAPVLRRSRPSTTWTTTTPSSS